MTNPANSPTPSSRPVAGEETDGETLTSDAFAAWLAQVDDLLAREWPDYPLRNVSGQPLNAEAWRLYFDDGMTASEALFSEREAIRDYY